LNRDFRDMLCALSVEGADFLVVGAYALAVHGLPRATGDIDLWVRPTPDNAARVWRALRQFGAPIRDLTVADLATPDIVFQIGLPPHRIDLLTSITGVDFDDAWQDRVETELDGLRLCVLSKQHILQNKRAVGRPKDLADAAWLEANP
jgi:hypothetical protein